MKRNATDSDTMEVDAEEKADSSSNAWIDFLKAEDENCRRPIIEALKKIHKSNSERIDWKQMDLNRKAESVSSALYFWTPRLPRVLFFEEVLAALAIMEPPNENDGVPVVALDVRRRELGNTNEAMPDLVALTENTRPKDMLSNELKKLESTSINAPFLVMIQSSGYGKTKTVLELAKSRRVVYLLCNDINGGWSRPLVMSKFVEAINKEPNEDARIGMAKTFLEAVIETARPYTTASCLYNAQFSSEGHLSTFYEELEMTHTERVMQMPTRSPDPTERLIVVFDESRILANEKKYTGKSAYRCIRAMLRELNGIGIFLDTFGSTDAFMPEGADSDRIESLGRFLPPVFEIDTFDEHAKDGWWFMGRPLWKMQWEYRQEKSLQRLVDFAVHKLRRLNTASTDGLIALFLCRFGLNATGELAKKLVASHMATLFGVSVDRKQLLTTYKSEPILAEASAYHTAYHDETVEAVLQAVIVELQNKVLTSAKGDRGEIAAAAWFGYTLDRLRKKERYHPLSMSSDVSVLSVIHEMCPNVLIGSEIQMLLTGWTVGVTHFCRLGYSPSRSILQVAVQRHVGFYLPEGEEGVDFLIAATNAEKGCVAAIRVQVKNYTNSITENSKKNMFQKLDVRRCTPLSTFDEEPVSIAFLVQVGTGSMASSVYLQTLGRPSRNTTEASVFTKQVQIACSMRSAEKSGMLKGLQEIAGQGIGHSDFTLSSEHFHRGELVEAVESDLQ